MTDHDLLQAYAQGRNQACLGEFVERYQSSMLRYATRIVGSREAAQDVVQEAFLRVAKKPKRLLEVKSCHNWLLRVTRNIGIDHLRKVKRHRKHVERAAERIPRETRATDAPLAVAEKKELQARMRAEIDKLPTRYRELLLLRIQEHKTYREIAEITGLTATHVGYLLHHAVKALTVRLNSVGQA
ncbi:MAG: RNA polymerase sigma factor [Planctomycetota bacterium]|jgi:RNA polymerase sigma-70 factor (ECF subfamily)